MTAHRVGSQRLMGLPYPIPGPIDVQYAIEIDRRPATFTRAGPFIHHMHWATRAEAEQLQVDLLHHPDVLDARIVQELSTTAPWEPPATATNVRSIKP